jgi:hypothetical protein
MLLTENELISSLAKADLQAINLNRYDTKRKNAKNANERFCTKLQKKRKWKYLHFVS